MHYCGELNLHLLNFQFGEIFNQRVSELLQQTAVEKASCQGCRLQPFAHVIPKSVSKNIYRPNYCLNIFHKIMEHIFETDCVS